MNLDNKIDLAKKKIKDFYDANHGKVFISFSGGKDSTVLKHLIHSMYPDVKVAFSNTTNENKDVVRFVKTFSAVDTVFPKMNFKTVLQKKGFPLVSKEVSQKVYELKHTKGKRTFAIRKYGYQNHPDSITDKTNKDGIPVPKPGSGKCPNKWQFLAKQKFDITNKCCYFLKKEPLQRYAKENSLKPFMALMGDEGKLRMQLKLYGKEDENRCYPFLKTNWIESDIWEYAKRYNIRFAECYYDREINGVKVKGEKRTGCELCAYGIHLEEENRLDRVKLESPKRFELIMNTENNGVKFKDALEIYLGENKNA